MGQFINDYALMHHWRRKNIITVCGIVLLCFFFRFLFAKTLKTSCSDTLGPIVEPPQDSETCIQISLTKKEPSFKGHEYLKPQCDHIMKNMVNGGWIERQGSSVDEEKYQLDELYIKFRTYHEGFSASPFRSDWKCGYDHQPGSSHCAALVVDASAWCNPNSDRPCCTDQMSGYCVVEDNCTGPKSVNLAKFVYADVSDWVPHDSSCKMVRYTQETACALLHDNEVNSIGFIGNSLMRNMYSVVLQMLTDNYYNGSIKACNKPSLREKCINQWQNMDKYCLAEAMATNSGQLPGVGLCNGHLDTFLYFHGFWLASMGDDLKTHVSELLDKPGTYLLVGIGVHDRYQVEPIINEYLKPAFDVLSGHKWPKFLWVHQLKSGIFKPPAYIRFHGTDEDIDTFVEQIDEFCRLNKVPTLDLRPATTGVWSVDGTHYGTGVNLLKLQLFLNFLASGQVF